MAGISYELCFRKMLHVKAVYNAGQFGEKNTHCFTGWDTLKIVV